MRSWQILGEARPASHESRAQWWLWLHNQVAVFVLAGAQIVGLVATNHAALAAQWGPFRGRVYAGTIALIAVELLLWHFLYRRGGTEARWAAGLMAAWFAIRLFIAFARASIDVPVSVWGVLLFVYMLVSHLGYAMGGSRARH